VDISDYDVIITNLLQVVADLIRGHWRSRSCSEACSTGVAYGGRQHANHRRIREGRDRPRSRDRHRSRTAGTPNESVPPMSLPLGPPWEAVRPRGASVRPRLFGVPGASCPEHSGLYRAV